MIIKSAAATLLTVGLALSAIAVAHEPTQPAPMPPMAGMDSKMEASMQMHQVMMPNKQAEVPMSGNIDKDFAQMMSMHHQQAIDMVDIYIKHGRNPKLKAMAMKMKAAQREEIKKMAAYK